MVRLPGLLRYMDLGLLVVALPAPALRLPFLPTDLLCPLRPLFLTALWAHPAPSHLRPILDEAPLTLPSSAPESGPGPLCFQNLAQVAV